jgi:hypothetical protein
MKINTLVKNDLFDQCPRWNNDASDKSNFSVSVSLQCPKDHVPESADSAAGILWLLIFTAFTSHGDSSPRNT